MSDRVKDRRVKPGRLLLRWLEHPGDGDDPDFVVTYPRRCAGALIIHAVTSEHGGRDVLGEGRSFVDELTRRGYDLKTLRFSIDRAAPNESQ